ncbi:YsnF/AvaK domain-containing protein [Deinococcus altitudinis]|uniref:YsnF/AvaK domain-containing protein n=1 Tax=Deinococcus altitudinis TaxID=468914 RepID=UPI0038922B2F
MLELREELPLVVRESVLAGQVTVHREVLTRTETVVMELTRETLRIEVGAGQAAVYLGDELLLPGESREVLLYDEKVVVGKQAYVTQEVRVGKRTVTERAEYPLELQYEELVVNRIDAAGTLVTDAPSIDAHSTAAPSTPAVGPGVVDPAE